MLQTHPPLLENAYLSLDAGILDLGGRDLRVSTVSDVLDLPADAVVERRSDLTCDLEVLFYRKAHVSAS
jgi:hypothetical protein